MSNQPYGGTLPPQKLPDSKKTPEWGKACVNSIIGYRTGTSMYPADRKAMMMINTNMYWGDYNEDDFKLWTNPYKVDDGFPATPQNVNIIKPKIDLLIGEFSKRPSNYIAVEAGDDAASLVQKKEMELIYKMIDNQLASALAPEEVQPNGMTLEWIQEYMQKNFKTIGEQLANSIIDVVGKEVNIEHEFLKIWTDYLIKGEGIYYVYTKGGKTQFERVDPTQCWYHYNDSLEFIEKGDWFLRRERLTPYQIYDKYYDRLSEEQLDKLLEMAGYDGSFAMKDNKDVFSNAFEPIKFLNGPLNEWDNSNATTVLELYHTVWRSSKHVKYLTYMDENGSPQETIVESTYEPKENELVEEDWVTEIWEGFRVGNAEDFYFGIQPVEFQHMSVLQPNAKYLPYGGIRARKSLVEIMKPLQYLYILLWYRLELALARDKGKVITMDITQIPKSMGIDAAKWLHYLSSVGVNFVNPYEEGWDIPGREGGKPAQFNQMSAQDLTMSNVISDYIGLMDKVEQMVGDVAGVTKQRQGSINSNELVGNVERSVVQSANITEPLFWKMNQLKRIAYIQLLECSKYVYSSNGNKYIHYITHDGNRIYLEITQDFLFSDFNIYVSDSTKDHLKLQKLESLLQSAMQAGASLYEAAEIITDESIANIKARLKEVDNRRQQAEQQQSQMQQQIEQAKLAAMQEQTTMDREQKERDSIRKSETAINVALIQANTKQQGTVEPEDNSIEYEKLNLERQKLMADISNAAGDQLLASEQLKQNQQKLDDDYDLRLKEIAVKKIAANKPRTTKQ